MKCEIFLLILCILYIYFGYSYQLDKQLKYKMPVICKMHKAKLTLLS